MEILDYLAVKRAFFESNLEKFLPHPGSYPPALRQAMEYSLFAGGKRLRPILTLAAAEACGGSAAPALAAAAAVEMIHTYSLIHDDLPAMDDDDLRRGKPTSHKVFGEGMAILAGDALLTHAFTVVAESPDLADRARLIVRELAAAAGPRGMVAGQALDIQGLDIQDPALLNYIHSCKTGALIKASVRVGALAAGADHQLGGLTEYAGALGLAYQIVDDILDVQGSTEEMGKDSGSDAKSGKQTFVTLYGLEGSKGRAMSEIGRAVSALANLDGDFRKLHDLAIYMGQRTS